MNYWLRLYTGILDDPKVQRLEAEDFKGWINILCLAKEHDGLLPSLEDTAFRLRMSEADAERLVEVLVKRELLDRAEDGLTPHNWEERQFLSDADPTAAIRARRYRAKRNGHGDDTDNNGPVTRDDTDASRPPEKSRDRAETESETETETRAKPRRRTTCDEDFLAELQANPAYAAFDVVKLYHKMAAWCQNKGVQPTRSRLINWLNREDKPMGVGNGQVKTGKSANGAAEVGALRTTEQDGIRTPTRL